MLILKQNTEDTMYVFIILKKWFVDKIKAHKSSAKFLYDNNIFIHSKISLIQYTLCSLGT